MNKEARDAIVAFQVQQHLLLHGRRPLDDKDLDDIVRKMNFRIAMIGVVYEVAGWLLQAAAALVLSGIFGVLAWKMIVACIIFRNVILADLTTASGLRAKSEAIEQTLAEAVTLAKPGTNPNQGPEA